MQKSQSSIFSSLSTPRSLLSSALLFLLAWSPCPSGLCWGFRMEMNPDGVSGIWRCSAIKAESRGTGANRGRTESMGFRCWKLWVSQWFAALKSHCGREHCAQRPAVADSFTSTLHRLGADYQGASKTQIHTLDAYLKGTWQGLYRWQSSLQTWSLKKNLSTCTRLPFSYLILSAHPC